ncbi:MAG: preprotein translocase subunit SecY [Bacteroidota bacterium]|nr:preprotein translocase subunit SecY [Bacteroidota bacterium]
MKGLIQTLKNIWAIDELRSRIKITFWLIAIYRLGSYVVLPGVDATALDAYQSKATQGLFGLINMFAGGAFSRAAIFSLGIMPYISASIVVQLLGIALPSFQKMQREGESGRQRMNQITRFLTIIITVVQAASFLVNLKSTVPGAIVGADVMSPFLFMFVNIVLLTAGTMFVMYLGEKITDRGLGNGVSLIIMIGIIARLPQALFGELEIRMNEAGGGLVIFLVELAVLFLVVIASIALVQATRRIPIQYAKRVIGNKQYGGQRSWLPLKINAAGVMPIIFAQALMFIPATVASFFPESASWRGIAGSLQDHTSLPYSLVYATLIIIFTYVYTAITINPVQIADELKRNGGFVPGVKPGKPTAEYIDTIMSRITFPGSIFLALVAIFPFFAARFGISSQFSQFFGGTSLLILVGVVLDTLQQIESHLLMRHYDGFWKGGKIKGRNALPTGVTPTI